MPRTIARSFATATGAASPYTLGVRERFALIEMELADELAVPGGDGRVEAAADNGMGELATEGAFFLATARTRGHKRAQREARQLGRRGSCGGGGAREAELRVPAEGARAAHQQSK